ncbi:WG containing repeat protein [anaerobic digester metagenome]
MSKIFPFYRKSEGKYCYLDKSGAVITDFKYSYAGELLNGVAKVACRNKWGFINSEGKELVPLIYDYCHDIKNGYAIVKTESKVGVINEHGHLCIPLQAGEIQQSSYYNIFSVFSPDNNKWGLVDCFNRTIKPHEYSNITFTNSPYIICAKTNDFELFNLKNNTTCLINNASSVEHLVDCFFEVRSLNNNVGFLNIHLNKIFWVSGSIQYIRIGNSNKYIFEVAKVNKENSISVFKDIFNENGKTILTDAECYVEHVDNNEGCIFFKKGTKWFEYNSINEKLSAGKFEHITNFHNGRAVATIANTLYIVDSNINAIEKLPFSYVEHWGTFSIVEKDGKWGVINLSFEVVIPIIYDRIDKLGNADVYYGFINDRKHIITPRGFVSKHCYQNYEDYTYEIAKRRWEDENMDELDEYNNRCVLYGYEDGVDMACIDLVDEFKNGVAWVFRNGFFGLINTNGVEITEFKYIIPKEIIGNIFLSPRESGYYDLDGNIYWM